MNSSSGMGDTGDLHEKIVVCRDREDLGERSAILFVRLVQEALLIRGRFAVALAGGTTPRTLYQRLANRPFSDQIPWKEVHLFWGDERAVLPDNPDSNYRMAHETLISHVPIPPGNVHRMPAEMSDLQAAAKQYEETLRRFFNRPKEGWPSFDLALLGIGSDGHTASLFPGSPGLNEKERWVAAPYVEKLKAARLTLTLPVFNHAKQVVFLISGRDKAPIMKEILQDYPHSNEIPAALIRPEEMRWFFLDQEAAALIDRKRKELQ